MTPDDLAPLPSAPPVVNDFGDVSVLRDAVRAIHLRLSAEEIAQFRTYGEMLIAESARINLTAITAPDAVQLRHFADSLTVVPAVDSYVREIGGDVAMLSQVRVLDVGSGAGFPGLPLAIVRPRVAVTLLEATGKKVAFLRRVADALDLLNVTALAMRAEEAGQHPTLRGQADIVVARGLARLPVLLEYCLPLVRLGGFVLAMKSERRAATDDDPSPTLDAEIADGKRVASVLGGAWRGAKRVPIPGLDDHILIRFDKTADTPAHYPRRPGIPAKTPLGT